MWERLRTTPHSNLVISLYKSLYNDNKPALPLPSVIGSIDENKVNYCVFEIWGQGRLFGISGADRALRTRLVKKRYVCVVSEQMSPLSFLWRQKQLRLTAEVSTALWVSLGLSRSLSSLFRLFLADNSPNKVSGQGLKTETHTHTNTHMRACTQACTHARTHSHTHKSTLFICTCTMYCTKRPRLLVWNNNGPKLWWRSYSG